VAARGQAGLRGHEPTRRRTLTGVDGGGYQTMRWSNSKTGADCADGPQPESTVRYGAQIDMAGCGRSATVESERERIERRRSQFDPLRPVRRTKTGRSTCKVTGAPRCRLPSRSHESARPVDRGVRPECYFVIEDSPNTSLSMQEAYIQSVAFTPSLLQRACDDELSALTPVMKPRAPWRSHM